MKYSLKIIQCHQFYQQPSINTFLRSQNNRIMFSKNSKSNPFNSPRFTNLINDQNENFFEPQPSTNQKYTLKAKKESTLQPLYSYGSHLSDFANRPYDMIEEPSMSDSSLNLDLSSYSTSSISNKKKVVSFDFDPKGLELEAGGSYPSKTLLKSSLKILPNEIESSTNFLKVSPSNKALESSNSLLSLGSFKSGLSCFSMFGKGTKSTKLASTEFQLKKYQTQVESMEYKKQLYKDNIFVCSPTSLGYRSEDKTFKEVKWLRLTELFKNRSCVLYDKSVNQRVNVNVGRFPTETMIKAMNKLKHIQGFVEFLFEDSKINQHGIYCLKIKIQGTQRIIIIDDFVPIVEQDNVPVPAFLETGKENVVEFWPFLLQKAYAKLFSTYQSLMEPQSVEDWMSTMIGHEVLTYNTKDQILRQILKQQSTDANYIFFKDQDTWQHTKLQPFIDPQEQICFTSNNTSTSLNLLSKKYPKLMILNQFQNCFNKIESLKLSKKCNFDICIYKFDLIFGSSIDIGVWQKDIKHFRGIGYKYSPIRLMLAMKQPTGEGFRWIDSSYSESKITTIRNWASKGEYYLILMIKWYNKPFQLNIKFTSEIEIQPLTRIDSSVHDKIIEQTASDIAQRFGTCKQVTDRVCIYKLIDNNLGMMMESIHNEHHRVIASVRKGYRVVSNSNGKLLPLTKNIQSGTLSHDIPPLKNIGTMIIALDKGDTALFVAHK